MRLLKKTKRDGIGVCHLTVKQANLQFLLEMEKIYTSITAEYIMRKSKRCSELLVITPAMPGSAA